MNETYEKEINLKWLFYRVLRAWRVIVVWAVIIALVLGCGSTVIKLSKLRNANFIENARLNYEREHASWVAQEENLRTKLHNLEKAKNRQVEYNEKSILMDIDPLRKNVASFELYVDYAYQINPELTYQSVDLSGRILKSYATYMTNGDMYNFIIDNLSYDIELRYLKEIMGVSIDYENNMISVNTVHSSDAKCQEVLSLAREGILSRYESVCAAIDDHKITATNQTSYETIDLTLEDTQEANVQYISDVDISIQEVNEDLRKWAAEPEPVFDYEVGTIIKSGIKAIILDGVIAFVALALFVAVFAVLSGKLLNPEDLKNRFDLRVIGLLPAKRQKKPFAWISRLFAKVGGITAKPEEYDCLARMIGSSIQSDLLSRKELPCKVIAFTGTAPAEEMERAVTAMGIRSYAAVLAPDMLTNAESVDKISNADCVVLLETQEVSVMANVEKELEALKAWNKTVLGVVVLNADAVM